MRLCSPSLRTHLAAAALIALGAGARAADVTLPSGTLSLELPEGYTELSPAELKAKFGRHGRAPLKAWGNAGRGSTVAVTWSEMTQPLTSARLPGLQAAMEQLLPRATPGLEFQRKALVDVHGRSWVLLESTAPAVDTQVHNVMYLTDVGGHMAGVNYNATRAQYPEQQAGFAASARTLRAVAGD